MKSTALSSLALFTAAATALAAADAPAPAVKLDYQLRLRGEWRENNFDFNSGADAATDDAWLLTRARIGLKAALGSGVSAYVQLQDARELGADRANIPFVAGAEGDDPLDVRQAWIEFGNSKDSPAIVKLGRQTLSFGDERLVGPLEWNNFSRTFDGARVTLPALADGWSADAFLVSVVTVRPSTPTEHSWSLNRSDTDDVFGGLYLKHALPQGAKLEPYVLWRHKTNDRVYTSASSTARAYDVPQKITTFGARLQSASPDKLDGWEYDGEFAWQTGEVRGRSTVGSTVSFPGAAWLNHDAWALHAGGGYTSKTAGFPVRVYAEYNRATGDKNPGDTRDESFLNLFPTNHKFYGGMDVFAWKNLCEFAVSVSAQPDKATKLRGEFHWFALDQVSDQWFRANGVATVRPLSAAARTAPRRAGEELDLVATRVLSPHVTAELGYSLLLAGPYLAATGASDNAQFVYLQTAFSW